MKSGIEFDTLCFEYDPAKSQSNKLKHGIDFEEAQGLWRGPHTEQEAEIVDGEKRFVVYGKIDDKNWTAAITYRGSNTRIISVRRSREDEKRYYEKDRRL